jgi:transposase
VFYRSFDNRRQVASFTGLTPSPFQSGSRDRDQGISKPNFVTLIYIPLLLQAFSTRLMV